MTLSSSTQPPSLSFDLLSERREDLKEQQLILHRLQIGLGITNGARGSLQKCTGGLYQKNPQVVMDLKLQQLEMIKLLLVAQRQEQEIQNDVLPVPQDASIRDLYQQWQSAQLIHDGYVEYEAMATIVNHPSHREVSANPTTLSSTSIQELNDQIQECRRQKQVLTQKMSTLDRALQIRQSQYHVLQSCLEDLKHSIEE
jgi:hypothetical protein